MFKLQCLIIIIGVNDWWNKHSSNPENNFIIICLFSQILSSIFASDKYVLVLLIESFIFDLTVLSSRVICWRATELVKNNFNHFRVYLMRLKWNKQVCMSVSFSIENSLIFFPSFVLGSNAMNRLVLVKQKLFLYSWIGSTKN
jgi:hypothetical protein